jgi:peroxiredoxin
MVNNAVVRALMIVLAVLMACTPAPVLNPHKKPPRRPGSSEVQHTFAVAPDSMVKKRDGSAFDLSTLWDKTKENKVVLVFYRGGWCPHCQKQMAELQAHYRDFNELKAIVVGVSNEAGPDMTAFRDKLGLGFELYSDPDLTMITKWGVEDVGAGIARPATFIIEPGGAIAYRKVGANPADHPKLDELLIALK